MHKVKARNLKRNESGKFNGDTGLMENPCKGVIKFEESIPLTAIAHYDGMDDCWILTKAEYESLTAGKPWLMSEASRQKILLAIDALKDSLTEDMTEDGLINEKE